AIRRANREKSANLTLNAGSVPGADPCSVPAGLVLQCLLGLSFSVCWACPSVPEVATPCEDHRQAEFVGGGDDLVVLLAATRLGNRHDSGCGGHLDSIREGKERVRGKNRPSSQFARLFAGN